MGEKILDAMLKRLGDAISIVSEDLATVRTGRAKPSLVENVKVEAYGSMMELREVAGITASDPSLIVITPWDKGLVVDIEEALRKADLGLSPTVDGDLIKIPIPMLTEERRLEYVKLVSQKIESGRVLLRQIRGEVKEDLDKLEGQPGISEDDVEAWLEEMQGYISEYTKKVEELGKHKEKELMTI